VATAEAAASRHTFLFPRNATRNAGADSNGLFTGRRELSAIAFTVTSLRPIHALRPDLDKFLFATVGEEIDGIPLSVVSASARLRLDPWEEAGRLSVLSRHEAVERLARLIVETPGCSRPFAAAREVVRPLVALSDRLRCPYGTVQRHCASRAQLRTGRPVSDLLLNKTSSPRRENVGPSQD
jgi:hypothetical protein